MVTLKALETRVLYLVGAGTTAKAMLVTDARRARPAQGATAPSGGPITELYPLDPTETGGATEATPTATASTAAAEPVPASTAPARASGRRAGRSVTSVVFVVATAVATIVVLLAAITVERRRRARSAAFAAAPDVLPAEIEEPRDVHGSPPMAPEAEAPEDVLSQPVSARPVSVLPPPAERLRPAREAVATMQRSSRDTDVTFLNVASADELAQIPGIGPRLAERIVAFRDHHGPVTALRELRGVPGIGSAKLVALSAALKRQREEVADEDIG
jgi:competence ComEA-like helix-hairpin-helix protein